MADQQPSPFLWVDTGKTAPEPEDCITPYLAEILQNLSGYKLRWFTVLYYDVTTGTWYDGQALRVKPPQVVLRLNKLPDLDGWFCPSDSKSLTDMILSKDPKISAKPSPNDGQGYNSKLLI